MIIGIISGVLFDSGYFYALLPVGTFLITLGMMMISLSSEYYQVLLAQGVCVGIGTGCLFIPSITILPQYFKRKRALANGIAASGSSIGGVLFPVIFYQLEGKIGFPWTIRVMGLLSLVTCTISISVMRLRFRPQDKRALLQVSAFKESQYSLFCLACFLGFLGFYNFLNYIQPYTIEKIGTSNINFYLIAILNAASTFGRIGPNYLADHVGSLNILFPALAITATLAYCWIAIHSISGVIALSATYGFFSGGFVSLVPVVMITITHDLRTLGTRLGMCFGLESIALLIGTPIGGAILDKTGSYLGVQVFCGSCLTACAAVLMGVRLLRSGPKLMYKT
jgi:predicted MFS family arabinose efflux permease